MGGSTLYKVMVVDDNATVLAIIKAVLGKEYEISTMESGVQALGYLKESVPPDVILLDLIMPGMGGLEVLKLLQEDPKLCNIAVIILSGMKRADYQVQAIQAGADDFIQKPVNGDILKFKIKHSLEVREIQRKNQFYREQIRHMRDQLNGLLN